MDTLTYIALGLGSAFGAALVCAGLADPDKIVGMLRLKDFHALRTIAVFVLVGMLGTWVLQELGMAHLSVKPAALLGVSLGGALLGAGFGMTGYCPGTGLAGVMSGRVDALFTVLGMFAGALAFILGYDRLVKPIDAYANWGKVTIPEATGIPATTWVLPIVAAGFLALYLTRPRKPQAASTTMTISSESLTPPAPEGKTESGSTDPTAQS